MHIHPVTSDRLANLLTNGEMIDILMERKKEGLVLSGNNGEGFIKWKYNNANVLKEQLSQSTQQLIDSQPLGSETRRGAENIKQVYESAVKYINKSDDVDHEALFSNHMSQHKEKWEAIMDEAAKQGNFYLTMAMLELEAEVMRDMVQHVEKMTKKKLDPKVKMELKLYIVKMVANWCKEYEKSCQDDINTYDVCHCRVQ
jgi:hypothetical protein